jgi:hypothetical protein
MLDTGSSKVGRKIGARIGIPSVLPDLNHNISQLPARYILKRPERASFRESFSLGIAESASHGPGIASRPAAGTER